MTGLDRIANVPDICHGQPVVRGLRYPVHTLLELLSSGMTFEEILDDYEHLERDDLLAALEYGALAVSGCKVRSEPCEVPGRRTASAQASPRAGRWWHAGDAIHTLDLPGRNATGEGEINRVADSEDRVVVTKDNDFRETHLLHGTPWRLLGVTTGNITNADLIVLFHRNRCPQGRIHDAGHVELSAQELILHYRRRAATSSVSIRLGSGVRHRRWAGLAGHGSPSRMPEF